MLVALVLLDRVCENVGRDVQVAQCIVDRPSGGFDGGIISDDEQEIIVAVRPGVAECTTPKEKRELWLVALQNTHNAVERLVCRSGRMSHL